MRISPLERDFPLTFALTPCPGAGCGCRQTSTTGWALGRATPPTGASTCWTGLDGIDPRCNGDQIHISGQNLFPAGWDFTRQMSLPDIDIILPGLSHHSGALAQCNFGFFPVVLFHPCACSCSWRGIRQLTMEFECLCVCVCARRL